MRIKSLKLQNIRSYVEETITFKDGSQLLSGDIGAGKSTVLLAIEYALFGTKRGELETTALLRNGSHAGRIELTFDLQGKEVTISRTLKRTPQSVKQEAGHIIINKSRIDATPVELRARIMELLGYPKEAQSIAKDLIYRYTVFTPQENMRQIIYDDKEIRLNTLRKVFNIDKYKKITENALFVAKEWRSEKRAFEETIKDIPTREEQKKNILKEKQAKERQSILQNEIFERKKKEKEAKAGELAEEEQRSLEYRRKKEQYALLQMQYETKQALFSQMQEKQVALLENIAQLRKAQPQILPRPTDKTEQEMWQEKEAIEKEINREEQEYALALQQEQSWTLQLGQLSKEIEQLHEAIAQKEPYSLHVVLLDEEIKKKGHEEQMLLHFENELALLTREEAKEEVKRKNAEDILRRVPGLQNCTLCLQDVAHEHKEKIQRLQKNIIEQTAGVLSEFNVLKKNILSRINEQKKSLAGILLAEKKRAVLDAQFQEIARKEKLLAEKQAMLKMLTQQREKNLEKKEKAPLLEKKKLHCAALKKIIDELRFWEKSVEFQKIQNQKILEKEEQLLALQREQNQIKQELDGIRTALQEADIVVLYAQHEQQLFAKKEMYEQLREQEKQEEIKKRTLEKELFYLEEQVRLHEAQLQERYATKEKVRKLQAYEQWLIDFFVPLVSTMEKQVLLQVHGSFNEIFTKWFSALIGEQLSARLDENFTPIIEQNGYETNVLDLSGGEKTAVALAYRLALNKVINTFMNTIHTKDLLILDEPTDGFSAEQLDKMRDVLEELQIAQLIVVSHETKIESFVDTVMRIEKQGYVSRVL